MRFSTPGSYKKRAAALLCAILALAILATASGCAVRERDEGPEAATATAETQEGGKIHEGGIPTTTPFTGEFPEVTPAPATPEPTEAPEPTAVPDYSGGIKRENRKTTVSLFGSGSQKPFCGTGHSIGVQFYATTEFNAVGFKSPTWKATENYYVDYALYKWDTDYYESIAGSPVAEGYFENWQDGVAVYLKFDPLPAGEYVLVALYGSNETMCNSGGWYMEAEHPSQRSYLDDEVWYDASVCCELVYIHTPNNKYGPLSDSGIG